MKPPDILLPTKPTFNSPLHLPNLPTTPIPVSELPPTAVRSPPMKSPPINPLLQNLTPIPPKQYTSRPPPNILNPQAKPAPTPSPATANQSQLISIQVPMAGPDGTQTLQTINVPRSVLAGASDRPILLTVTPKNGINKGQKQIVVLTKNTATGSTTAGLARPPGSPQTVIQGSQVLPQQQLGSIQSGSAQQHTGSPQQQLQQESKSVHLSPRPATVSASLGGAQSSPSIPQLVVRQQALSSPSRPALVPQGAQQVTAGVRQVSQQSIQQQTSSQVTKSIPNAFQGGP